MIIAPYDVAYAPAAIVLPVIIEADVSGRSAIMGLFVDVLATRSVLAASVVDDLGLTLFGLSSVTGADGGPGPFPVPLYFATIWVEDRAHWTCVLGHGDVSYVGRDVLDQLNIKLDGPNQRMLASLDAPPS